MDEIAQRRDLFRSLALGVIELDGSGRIQFASQVACDLLGYPAEELHGAPAHEALHATTLDGAPLSHAACPLCGALARGGEARGWEGLFRQANGAPMRVIASATGSLDDHGRPCGGLIAFQAPADQPGIDERLQERAAELAEAQRIARLGSWSWDIQTDRTYWTAQVYEILGVDCAEWQNTYEAFLALVHPEDRDSVARAMESSLEEGGYAELDFRIIRPDSAVRWVRERYYCDRAEDGTPLWVRGTVQDITEYVEVTQKLEEAVRTKTEFLHAVNHDLRNSLYALSGLVGRLGRTTTGESQSHWIGLADGAIRHMLGLVDTLTDIAQLEQGHLKLRRQWTPLHSFLDEHRSLFAEQAAEKGLSFHWKVDPTLAEAVWLDPTRVSQVLNNLVGNAIKFTDEGWVQVEFRSINDEYLGVSVEDTGPGVRNEDQARIFEPFERAPPGECRLQGTGFGLTICQRLIRMMDGDLTLYSTPGQGSRFVATIRVPLTAEGGGEAAQPSRVDSLQFDQACDADGLTLLVADDEPINAMLVQGLLERRGARVTVVPDGQEAVQAWLNGQPDAVLLDVQMPRLGGVEALERIRRLEREQGRERTPAALVTAQDPAVCKRKLAAVDADTCLYKPVTEPLLKQALAELMARRSPGYRS